MKNFKLVSIYLMLMFILGGCNTMEGAGEDLQSAGSELEDAARDNK